MAAVKSDQDRRFNGLAIAAQADAVRKLKEAHSEEFAELLTASRLSKGLSAQAGGESTRKIEARLEAQLAKVEKLKEQLALRGVAVETSEAA